MGRGFTPPYLPAADEPPTASLQSGLPDEYVRLFQEELGGWFQALKWLIKEFRLQVGYETLDEEAHIRFWIDRYESKNRGGSTSENPGAQDWPTADEPALPATSEETAQARTWPRKLVEEKLSRFFDLRLVVCPRIPILVPLRQLQNYDAPRGSSAKQRQSALHQFRAVPVTTNVVARPAEARRSATPSRVQASSKTTTPTKARPLSKDTRQRLFPNMAVGGQRLTDEQFASRVVDLAIAFDGDAIRASRYGAKFLTDGVMPPSQDIGEAVRRWVEGRDSLDDITVHGGPDTLTRGLVGFWNLLTEKASLGLMVPSVRAERVLRMRARGDSFFEDVLRMYMNRFKYECLDAKVLHRFWVSMSPAVKSMHHVRGMSERRAFEILREGVRVRTEQRHAEHPVAPPSAATTPRSSSGARPCWRPAGDSVQRSAASFDPELLKSARDIVLSKSPGKGTGLEMLAKPKLGVSPLSLLRRLRRQYPEDTVISRMIRQSMEGFQLGVGAVPTELGMLEAQTDGEKLKLLLDPEKAHTAEASLRATFESSRRIKRFLMRQAKEFLKTARVNSLGPRFGVELLEEFFARLCRFEGTTTMLERFGPVVTDIARPGGLIRAVNTFVRNLPQLRGGMATDCSTRKADCSASSSAPGTTPDDAVDGDPDTGWRPDLQKEHRFRLAGAGGATEFKADLGRVHSCVGLVLEWSAPPVKRVEVNYVDRVELRADITLEGGDGEPVKVAHVNKGGAASNAGVLRGYVLKFDVGGSSDQLFMDLPAADAIQRMQEPQLVSTPAKLIFDPPVEDVLVQVEVGAQKAPGPSWDTVWKQENDEGEPNMVLCKPGIPTEIPCVFVGRLVRLVFPKEWPRLFPGGPELSLTAVRVVKVWRLAPPAFRMAFLDALRCRPEVELQQAATRIAAAGGNSFFGKPNTVARALRDQAQASEEEDRERMKKTPQLVGPWRPISQIHAFWAPAGAPAGLTTSSIRGTVTRTSSFNELISKSINSTTAKLGDMLDPDFELWVQKWKPEDYRVEEAMKKVTSNRQREFHLSVKKDALDLKKLVHAREEDARECTFHPRAAGATSYRVTKLRVDGGADSQGVQLVDFQGTNIKEHVKGMGEYDLGFVHFEQGRWKVIPRPQDGSDQNYKIVSRMGAFSRARKQFSEGNFEAALTTLKEKFDVDDIISKFECHAPGCGKKLDREAPINCKGCSAFYCEKHADPATHSCAEIKIRMRKKEQARKEERERLKEDGKKPPARELFPKAEAGFLFEVRDLLDQIREARRTKAKSRKSLERLGQSIRQFGAIRLVERPFRHNMCTTHFRRQRSLTRDGGDPTPLLGPLAGIKEECCCPLAHHPSELRFAAGESESRRIEWVDRALQLQNQKAEVRFGSDADRRRAREQKAQRDKGEGEETGLYQKMKRDRQKAAEGRRPKSAPRPMAPLRRDYQARGEQVQQAKRLESQAWSAYKEGDIQGAMQHLNAAAEAAAPAAMADLVGGGSSAPRLPPKKTAAAGGLFAEDGRWPSNDRLFPRLDTDANAELALEEPESELLAVSSQAGTGRPLRTGERLELMRARQQQGRQARDVLDSCDNLDLQILRDSWAQPREDQLQEVEEHCGAILEQLGGDAAAPEPPPPFDDSPPGPRAGGRKQMCANMLATGRCARGRACPDAHAPAELASHTPKPEEMLFQNEACPTFFHSWERHLAI